MVGVWTVLVLIFCSGDLLVSANEISPLGSVNASIGQRVAFICGTPNIVISNVQWIVNGSSLEELDLGNATTTTQPNMVRQFSGLLVFSAVPAYYNGTTVRCVVTFADNSMLLSNVATLLVQGLLDAVSDVSVQFVSPSFTISWRAPFTLSIPGSPGITYCISITNSSTGSSLGNETCGIIATNHSAELEFSACAEYTAVITPRNEAGNGTPETKTFPEAPGVDSITSVSQSDGVLVYEILLDVPACTCEVALAEGTIDCMATGSSVIFRIGDPFFNQFLTATVTLHRIRLNDTSPVNISTHDVDAIAVFAAPNAVDLSASFVDNSPALGVLFLLLFSSTNQSVFLVLDRVMANGFMQGDITQGNYTVLAFDVEDDGVVELGPSSPAAVGSITVPGQDLPSPFSYPPVAGLQCSVESGNNSLVVSCNFNTTTFVGYFVVLHFAGDCNIISESRNLSTPGPVEFVGLNSGLYSVIVFPLTDNGIIGTSAMVYTRQIDVTTPPTIPPTITTAATSPLPGTPDDSSFSQTTTIIIAVMVVLVVLAAVVVSVASLVSCGVVRSKRGATQGQPTPEPYYEEVFHEEIELKGNRCYEHNIKLETNAAYGHVQR